MSSERSRLAERISYVEGDLADLEEQVAAGELDQETAERLRRTYLTEVEGLREELGDLPDDTTPRPRSPRRTVAGTLILGLGAAAIVTAAVLSLQDRAPGGNATGGIVSSVGESGGVDLAGVSTEEMEEVVAANPDVVGMRLALARRYMEAREFSRALDHYMIVLEGGQHPEALANVGWMTYLSDRPDVAESFVEQALAIQADYPLAYWYLATIRFDGLDDLAGAVEPLRLLLSYDELPADIRVAAEQMLVDAEAGR